MVIGGDQNWGYLWTAATKWIQHKISPKVMTTLLIIRAQSRRKKSRCTALHLGESRGQQLCTVQNNADLTFFIRSNCIPPWKLQGSILPGQFQLSKLSRRLALGDKALQLTGVSAPCLWTGHGCCRMDTPCPGQHSWACRSRMPPWNSCRLGLLGHVEFLPNAYSSTVRMLKVWQLDICFISTAFF